MDSAPNQSLEEVFFHSLMGGSSSLEMRIGAERALSHKNAPYSTSAILAQKLPLPFVVYIDYVAPPVRQEAVIGGRFFLLLPHAF